MVISKGSRIQYTSVRKPYSDVYRLAGSTPGGLRGKGRTEIMAIHFMHGKGKVGIF